MRIMKWLRTKTDTFRLLLALVLASVIGGGLLLNGFCNGTLGGGFLYAGVALVALGIILGILAYFKGWLIGDASDVDISVF